METLFMYFFKVFLCSGVLFLYYQLSLKDKTFHHYNRFYLLSAAAISLLLPLLKVEDFTIEVNADLYFLLTKIENIKTYNSINDDYTYFKLGFAALALVSVFFVGRLIFGIFKILRIRNKFKKETLEGINFYQTNLSDAPFSYFKNLFWKHSLEINSDLGKQILKHEMVHIEQKHSYDKIFMELLSGIFWFNPVYYVMKKEIFLIHEYLADKKAVRQSDTKAFAQMLLAGKFSADILPGTNPFLSSNLKKRLKMIQKPQTKFGYLRRISALPIVFTLAFAYLVNAKNREITETNIEIAKAVESFKSDTIVPKNNTKDIQAKKIRKSASKAEKLAEKAEKKAEEAKNEYDQFYLKAVEARREAIEKQKSANNVMKETILKMRESNGFNDAFKKDRDYEKQPLTKAEIELLKRDAEKIRTDKEKINSSAIKNYAIFKTDDYETVIYDRTGKVIVQKPMSLKSDIIVMNVNGEELFINGKKVSKDEFMKFQSDFADVKTGEKKIRKMIVESVSDGNFAYPRKMSITTENLDYVSRFYVDGKQVTKEDVDKILPYSITSVNVINGKNGAKGEKTVEISTTK